MSLSEKYNLGATGKIVEAFLTSKLPIIFIIGSLLAGVAALIVTPREEEPQIVVPLVDVIQKFPRRVRCRSSKPCHNKPRT